MNIKPSESWEKRSLRFVLKAAGVLFFLAYVAITAGGAWTWGQMKWIRTYPVTTVTDIAEKYLHQQSAPEKLTLWISLRESKDLDFIIEKLEPYAGEMASSAFFVYTQRMTALGKIEDAVFWTQYARFRSRFDALRCGSPNAVKLMTKLMDAVPNDKVQGMLDQTPKLMEKSIRAVLAFDRKHPAQNDPSDICKTLQRIEGVESPRLPKEEWETVRHTLHVATEASLQDMGKNK